MNLLRSILGRLRLAAIVEGLSWLALLFIAMPIKYFGDNPVPVTHVGRLHGLLFVLFLAALFHAWRARGWTIHRAAAVFLSAIVPFGFLWMEPSLRAEQRGAE